MKWNSFQQALETEFRKRFDSVDKVVSLSETEAVEILKKALEITVYKDCVSGENVFQLH